MTDEEFLQHTAARLDDLSPGLGDCFLLREQGASPVWKKGRRPFANKGPLSTEGLSSGFYWEQTPEGHCFWRDCCDYLSSGRFTGNRGILERISLKFGTPTCAIIV